MLSFYFHLPSGGPRISAPPPLPAESFSAPQRPPSIIKFINMRARRARKLTFFNENEMKSTPRSSIYHRFCLITRCVSLFSLRGQRSHAARLYGAYYTAPFCNINSQRRPTLSATHPKNNDFIFQFETETS